MLDPAAGDVRTLRPSGVAVDLLIRKEIKNEVRSLKASAPRKPRPERSSSSTTPTGATPLNPSASRVLPFCSALPRPRTAPEQRRVAVARRRAAEREEHPTGKALASAGMKGYRESRAVRPQTRHTYVPILDDFWSFAKHLPQITCDEDLGERLLDFAHHSYFEGMPAAYRSKLKAALGGENARYSRHGAGRLPRFARALQAWTRLSPGTTRPPLPWLHLVLIVLDLLHDSMGLEALFFITTFVSYFRPGESLAIQMQDVVKASPPLHMVASIQLHPESRGAASKTGFFDDGVSLDSATFPSLGSLLVELAQNREPSAPLFDRSYAHMTRVFEKACDRLGIQDRSMYRLMHGGASHDRASNARTLAEIKKRGRWAADSSLRRYERAVRLQQVGLTVGAGLLHVARKHADRLETYIRGSSPLPPCPWRSRTSTSCTSAACLSGWPRR